MDMKYEFVGYCHYCGNEIYRGEFVYEIKGKLIHKECIGDYLIDELGGPGVAALCGLEDFVIE